MSARPRIGLIGPFILLSSLLFTGCETDPDVAPARHFGSPYEIVTSPTTTSPEMLPAIEQDSLVVRIRYPGGCADHDFAVHQRNRHDTTRIWIAHDANGDDCEAMLDDEIREPLDETILESKVILLLDPNGGPPYPLK